MSIYNVNSAALAKWRFRAKAGLKSLSFEERRAYANAVEAAVLSSQRAWLRGGSEKPIGPPMCASGTWHNNGEDIGEAVRAKQRAALSAAPGRERRARTPAQWTVMYELAMADKRKRRLATAQPKESSYETLSTVGHAG